MTTFMNIKFNAIAVSPSETTTPLQIVCFTDQTISQTMAGGTEAVDKKFHGEIKRLRADDLFRGKRFETLLLTPWDNQIPARTLLLMGLGDPETLTLEDLKTIGKIAVHEALKLGVMSFSFAPSIKDAGITKFEAADVSEILAQGMLKGIKDAKTLEERKLIPMIDLKEITFLAGAQHLENSQAGLRKVFGND